MDEFDNQKREIRIPRFINEKDKAYKPSRFKFENKF